MLNRTVTIINNLIKKALDNYDSSIVSNVLWKKASPHIQRHMDNALKDKDYHRYIAGHAYKIVQDDVHKMISSEAFIDKIIERIKRKQL